MEKDLITFKTQNLTKSRNKLKGLSPMRKLVMGCVLMAVFLSACLVPSSIETVVDQVITNLAGEGSDQADELTLAWQKNIDDLWELLYSQPLPIYLMEDDPVLQGDEFDFMTVFSILDHLRVVEGYRLAYVYRYDGMGGYPIIYAHPEDKAPYQSINEYAAEYPECFDRAQNPPHCNVLTYLETDGSELGFLQLILFDMMKEQFYLYWHSAYRDRRFLATPDALSDLIEKLDDPFYPFTPAQIRKAKRIDLAPKVAMGAETVEIRAVWFTKWGGFHEANYVLSKDQPHLILEAESQNLMEYDCGIMF